MSLTIIGDSVIALDHNLPALKEHLDHPHDSYIQINDEKLEVRTLTTEEITNGSMLRGIAEQGTPYEFEEITFVNGLEARCLKAQAHKINTLLIKLFNCPEITENNTNEHGHFFITKKDLDAKKSILEKHLKFYIAHEADFLVVNESLDTEVKLEAEEFTAEPPLDGPFISLDERYKTLPAVSNKPSLKQKANKFFNSLFGNKKQESSHSRDQSTNGSANNSGQSLVSTSTTTTVELNDVDEILPTAPATAARADTPIETTRAPSPPPISKETLLASLKEEYNELNTELDELLNLHKQSIILQTRTTNLSHIETLTLFSTEDIDSVLSDTLTELKQNIERKNTLDEKTIPEQKKKVEQRQYSIEQKMNELKSASNLDAALTRNDYTSLRDIRNSLQSINEEIRTSEKSCDPHNYLFSKKTNERVETTEINEDPLNLLFSKKIGLVESLETIADALASVNPENKKKLTFCWDTESNSLRIETRKVNDKKFLPIDGQGNGIYCSQESLPHIAAFINAASAAKNHVDGEVKTLKTTILNMINELTRKK